MWSAARKSIGALGLHFQGTFALLEVASFKLVNLQTREMLHVINVLHIKSH